MKKIKIRMLEIIRMLKIIGMLNIKIKNPLVRTMVGGLILWSAVVLGGGALLYFIGRMFYFWSPSFFEFLFPGSSGFWGFIFVGLYLFFILLLIGIVFCIIIFITCLSKLGKDIYRASATFGNFLFNNISPVQLNGTDPN